jgi:hypothetical protein
MVTKNSTEDIAGKRKSKSRTSTATGPAIKNVAGNIATPAKADTNGYKIVAEEWGFTEGTSNSQCLAALSTRSALTATTYKAFSGGGDKLEVTDLMGELRKAGDEVVAGDMGRIERMLTNQALTLDAIFNNMAQRSGRQESFKGIEVLMRLALKAQAQSRSTAEALAEIKNPRPVSFVKQANMTTGPQQVNNTYASTSAHSDISSPAENFQSEQNKLLETDHGQRMDARAQSQAGRVNQTVDAMEAVHRT